ncbi:MAG TPA: acetyl-CoA carboxylase carboxyltransferase subunit alpha [Candidatus Anaerobutyricum faecale]|nr:acetyl-CoA carboxylase carboxyltransferase subunit alpha [Candidatus Anaerobutyricum faecale]
MDLNKMFKKTSIRRPSSRFVEEGNKPEAPKGLLKKCNKCGKAIFTEEYKNNLYICPKCGGYLRMPAYERIALVTEEGSFEEWDTGLVNTNPLRMKGYPDKVKALQEKTGLDEAVVTGKARIGENEVVIMVMDGRFMTASMGAVVGEKVTRGIEKATEMKLPIVIFTCSGGARMQEGMTSLMQMEKTAAALKRHSDAGLLYIAVQTDPTTGGVTASFASLGDIILAEPKALIGFAGPRVIEQTIHQKLPKGFQRSEFLLEHGFVDRIVERQNMKEELRHLLDLHRVGNDEASRELKDLSEAVKKQGKYKAPYKVSTEHAKDKTAWERVALARAKGRPIGEDYIHGLFDEFVEFHGDRYFGDDHAICGGIALFHGQPVTVIAQMKGKNTQENMERNFGMPMPEGYRKSLRLMKQAEKFHRPIICFVDTPGAYPGMGAEERGQGEAIARNLFHMSDLKTPILSILIGEGGSGGALAMAVADEVWALENAIYSILSPEGFASILWKNASLAEKAAKAMKLTSYDLYKAGFVETIIPEPETYTLETMLEICEHLDEMICAFLKEKMNLPEEELIEARYARFRRM